MNWQKELDLSNIIEYTGTDIVKDVIDSNIYKFKDNHKFKFKCQYITEIKDKIDTDLIICREVLFHLSLNNINKILNIIKFSSAKYLLVTTHENTQNINIQNGQFFALNLTSIPFNLPQPIEKCREDHRDNRYLYLYDISTLK